MPTEWGGRISTPRKTTPKKTTRKLTPEDVKNLKTEESPEIEVNSRRLITKTVEFNNLHKALQDKLSTKNYWDFKIMIQNLFNIKTVWTFKSWNISFTTDKWKEYWIEAAKDFLYSLNCYVRNTSSSGRYYDVGNKSKYVFNIKEIYTQDGFYIFKSTKKDYYHAKIEDFDTNGIAAKSFSFGKPEVDKEENRVKDFVIQESDTAISLTKEDEVISTIVWDHITIVNKDRWHMVIVHNNLIEYLRIDKNGKQYHMGKPFSHHYGQIEKLKIDRNSNFLLLMIWLVSIKMEISYESLPTLISSKFDS